MFITYIIIVKSIGFVVYRLATSGTMHVAIACTQRVKLSSSKILMLIIMYPNSIEAVLFSEGAYVRALSLAVYIVA